MATTKRAGRHEGVARLSSASGPEQLTAPPPSRAAPRATAVSQSRATLALSPFLLLSSAESVALPYVALEVAGADIADVAREQITGDSVALFWQLGHPTNGFSRD